MSSSFLPPPPRSASEPWIDWGKAIASQLIVWHHLTFYGPMVEAAAPLAPALFDWLADQARIAVQVFLVMGGYLGARSLLPEPGRVPEAGAPRRAAPPAWRQWLGLVSERYWRLMRPGLVALGVAVLAAALTRQLISDPDTPAAPGPLQLMSNILLLHDWLGHEALSAGLWYVAIDWQLHAGLAALACWHQRSGLSPLWRRRLVVGGVVLACTASLLWVNRQPEWDVSALYFFGAYGLGMLAFWLRRARPATRHTGALLLGLLVTLALWIDWRERVLVAALSALLLLVQPMAVRMGRSGLHPLMRRLADISYPVFLLHYAVCMLTGALVHRFFPGQIGLNATGMMFAWILSLLAGWGLMRSLDTRTHTPLARPASKLRASG